MERKGQKGDGMLMRIKMGQEQRTEVGKTDLSIFVRIAEHLGMIPPLDMVCNPSKLSP
jgi:hypothetical protein